MKGIIHHVNPQKYLEEKPKILKLGLDEAQAVSASVKGGVTKTAKLLKAAPRFFGYKEVESISEFRFEPVDKTGSKSALKNLLCLN